MPQKSFESRKNRKVVGQLKFPELIEKKTQSGLIICRKT